MSTSINVSKQSVSQLLESGREKPFVIPEYQRPYEWTDEQIETLFEDIWEFASTSGGTERNGTYFLGCIVACNNEGKQDIIDGQQRITSLYLLLRSIYTNLFSAKEHTKEAENFMRQIEPVIWQTNKLTGIVDYSHSLLTSLVINNVGNEVLSKILETGVASPTACDNYSKNYITFQKLFSEHAAENPMMVYQFIYALLNQAILLPISADSRDTALTIFTTLNNRGLPLSDADIFKASIYNHLEGDEKLKFINEWQKLDDRDNRTNESTQQLFYYYMFYLRALKNDKKTTTPGIRKYYLSDNCANLYDDKLMSNLFAIQNFLSAVNYGEPIDNESWSTNSDIINTLDILSSYPNEYWKYPVIIFYLSHRANECFENDFLLFLRKLSAELLAKYLVMPTVNAVKADIMKLNAEIIGSTQPKFDFKETDMSNMADLIKNPHKNVVRMLLKMLAYDKQNERLKNNWEIEHILPIRWQSNYFLNVKEQIINERIEHLGNKLPLDKQSNIVAGNGYFDKKKQEYAKSAITIVREMSEEETHDWNLDNIEERDVKVSDTILNILKNWNKNYPQ